MPSASRTKAAVAAGYWIVGLAAAAYIAARAWLVPLTYDEAVVALRYMSAPWAHLFEVGSGTNHFLNTVLARAAAAVVGPEPWAIRLPNVLAGVGYLVAMAAVTRRAASHLLGLAGFTLLVAHPFLLDYFAVSRGYGLAIGLLMGSVWALLAWQAPAASRRWLVLAVSLAVAAVAASFTVLPATAGVLAVVLARVLWRGRSPAAPRPDRGWHGLWRDGLIWALVTGLFSAAVFSRDRELSSDLFDAVAVRVVGLLPDELAEVEVFRADAAGRFHPLDRQPGGHWTLANPRGVYGLRVVLPAEVDRNLSSLDVTIGAEVFRRTRRADGPWEVRDGAAARVLSATPALRSTAAADTGFASINMRGRDAHGRVAIRFAGLVLAGLSVIGVVVSAIFALVARLRGADAADLRLVLRAGMATASLCAAPAYLLRTNNQLYFGGTTGLMADTFGSVLAAVVYVVPSWPGQGPWAAGVVAVCAALVVGAVIAGRPRERPGPLVMAGILAVVALQVELQHRLLQTPYLIDRTALFVLPLIVLAVVLSTDVLAGRGRAWRVVMTALVGLLAGGAMWHAVTVANLSQSRDVPNDASTPAMLRIIAADVAANVSGPAVVRVGVEWMYFPVAQYYAARLSTPARRYDVTVVPADDVVIDYFYCRQSADGCQGRDLASYPATGSVLRRASR